VGATELAIDVPSQSVATSLAVDVLPLPCFELPLSANTREARLLADAPWCRSAGSLEMRAKTEGWRFPAPAGDPKLPETGKMQPAPEVTALAKQLRPRAKQRIRLKPTAETVLFKHRLLYLLQPPLDHLFDGKQVAVPFQPFPYQLEGIAFLMPRENALLADEMGLGKTAQAILSIRLLFQSRLLERVLIVCPKALVFNWSRELRLWADDLPFEVIGGDTQARQTAWTVSNCPVKLVNYELLTRDADVLNADGVHFDLVILDEAQRIKNHDAKTSRAARSINRTRSWALTGTPIENRPEDLINIFAFVDPGRVPADTPSKRLPQLTGDSILRRTKEDVQSDMPPKFVRDVELQLTEAQREAYDLAEKDGVIHLNELGDTVTIRHVFQLVMRLKQICNFDPLTGQSAKLEQLLADLEEVAENGRKAIVFSQWVEPLEVLARALESFGPLLFHGKVPTAERPFILDRFQNDPSKHVILMSYGTGSVGLNLQFANYVFLFDRWWNPAVEDQAINRAHRIGQRHPVTVTRFITENTIENRIASVLEKKRQLFNELLEQNCPPPQLGLTEEEIFGLFDIRARPKKPLAV
jgi:SNF2 family DNA or RNA helicase